MLTTLMVGIGTGLYASGIREATGLCLICLGFLHALFGIVDAVQEKR